MLFTAGLNGCQKVRVRGSTLNSDQLKEKLRGLGLGHYFMSHRGTGSSEDEAMAAERLVGDLGSRAAMGCRSFRAETLTEIPFVMRGRTGGDLFSPSTKPSWLQSKSLAAPFPLKVPKSATRISTMAAPELMLSGAPAVPEARDTRCAAV